MPLMILYRVRSICTRYGGSRQIGPWTVGPRTVGPWGRNPFFFNRNLYFHVDTDSMALYPVSSSLYSCRLEFLLPRLRSPCLEANLPEPLALLKFLISSASKAHPTFRHSLLGGNGERTSKKKFHFSPCFRLYTWRPGGQFWFPLWHHIPEFRERE